MVRGEVAVARNDAVGRQNWLEAVATRDGDVATNHRRANGAAATADGWGACRDGRNVGDADA